MTISDSSSPAVRDTGNHSAPQRKTIYLTGPSVQIDAEAYACRRDLAEIALAGHVFAQHYAVPLRHIVIREVPIHKSPRADSECVATLAIDDNFQVLDIGNDWAWGRGDARGTTGYVVADALNLP